MSTPLLYNIVIQLLTMSHYNYIDESIEVWSVHNSSAYIVIMSTLNTVKNQCMQYIF